MKSLTIQHIPKYSFWKKHNYVLQSTYTVLSCSPLCSFQEQKKPSETDHGKCSTEYKAIFDVNLFLHFHQWVSEFGNCSLQEVWLVFATSIWCPYFVKLECDQVKLCPLIKVRNSNAAFVSLDVLNRRWWKGSINLSPLEIVPIGSNLKDRSEWKAY